MLFHERALGKYAAREMQVKHVDRIKPVFEKQGQVPYVCGCLRRLPRPPSMAMEARQSLLFDNELPRTYYYRQALLVKAE